MNNAKTPIVLKMIATTRAEVAGMERALDSKKQQLALLESELEHITEGDTE